MCIKLVVMIRAHTHQLRFVKRARHAACAQLFLSLAHMLYTPHANLSRVILSKAQLITADIDFDRVAKRGHLAHRHKRARRDAHINKPSFERPASVADVLDNRTLARREIH
ncbi:hypothetical protein SDC9_194037 [bioreactor metagenome]|uniref:Uncharacterized protein n=1 Tax=bioreactor metagenome TaxID=1076179 RepID=A0A645I573_9ZZZZ